MGTTLSTVKNLAHLILNTVDFQFNRKQAWNKLGCYPSHTQIFYQNSLSKTKTNSKLSRMFSVSRLSNMIFSLISSTWLSLINGCVCGLHALASSLPSLNLLNHLKSLCMTKCSISIALFQHLVNLSCHFPKLKTKFSTNRLLFFFGHHRKEPNVFIVVL